MNELTVSDNIDFNPRCNKFFNERLKIHFQANFFVGKSINKNLVVDSHTLSTTAWFTKIFNSI